MSLAQSSGLTVRPIRPLLHNRKRREAQAPRIQILGASVLPALFECLFDFSEPRIPNETKGNMARLLNSLRGFAR